MLHQKSSKFRFWHFKTAFRLAWFAKTQERKRRPRVQYISRDVYLNEKGENAWQMTDDESLTDWTDKGVAKSAPPCRRNPHGCPAASRLSCTVNVSAPGFITSTTTHASSADTDNSWRQSVLCRLYKNSRPIRCKLQPKHVAYTRLFTAAPISSTHYSHAQRSQRRGRELGRKGALYVWRAL